MKLKLSLVAVLVSTFSLNGCSVGSAINAATPVEYKKVRLNLPRSEVISILGIPKTTENKNNQKIDTFEFLDGLHQASKARIILYIAGDVFTAGLAEFIFWPLEKFAFDGKQCRGTVSYNSNDHVIDYDLLDSKGQHLWSSLVTPSRIDLKTKQPEKSQINSPIVTTENIISENKIAVPFVATKTIEKPKTSNSILITSQLIQKIQTALRDDHYYHGNIDGSLNEDTKNAISVYRQVNNLSGKSIDEVFLNSLGIE